MSNAGMFVSRDHGVTWSQIGSPLLAPRNVAGAAGGFSGRSTVQAPSDTAAKPGDILILWGTGFGATSPATPAGSVVSGAPAVAAAVTVTVAGLPATVLSAVLTTGSGGLYQTSTQLPVATPTGAVAVQASAGCVQSPAGILVFVGQ